MEYNRGFDCSSSIRRLPSNVTVISAATQDVLKCHTFVHFWVRWKDAILDVGQSRTLGANRLLYWSDPNPRAVHFITMSAGETDVITWELTMYKGR